MDYNEWAREYLDNAKSIQDTIDKLKKQKGSRTYPETVEVDEKIRRYRTIRYEFLKIADLLMRRAG